MRRMELAPGLKQLFEQGFRLYFPLKQLVDRSGGSCWGRLTTTQRRTINKVLGAWKGAADQGHFKAQYNLDYVYYEGQGVPQSNQQAEVWARKAADQGDAEAQEILCRTYFGGQSVSQSYIEAAVCYRKAADQGHAERSTSWASL